MRESTKLRMAYDPSAAVQEGVEEDVFQRMDMAIAKNIGETLHRHYPHYLWEVRADSYQGIASIKIPFLMGPTACYVLHIDKLDAAGRAVMLAGGEILERWRIPRSGIDIAAFMEASQKRVWHINDPTPS